VGVRRLRLTLAQEPADELRMLDDGGVQVGEDDP
jgi:hypothetical protein